MMSELSKIYFSCPNCRNKGVANEIYCIGGINDYGGFILKCKKCTKKFFLECRNPSIGMESTINGDFEIVEILDYEFENDKIKASVLQKASNLLVTQKEEEIPILRDAWNINPQFNINSFDKIFLCQQCRKNIEKLIFCDVERNLSNINTCYQNYFNLYVKGRHGDPLNIVFQSAVKCPSCKKYIKYLIYSKFNGRGEKYNIEDFLLSDISDFLPDINGLYNRKEAKRILEKFILRWNLLASQVYLISPFIGFDFNTEIRRDRGKYFIDLLSWLLGILDKTKTKLIVRRTEYNKIKKILGERLFERINDYSLLNPLIDEINNNPSPMSHAKFYAGIIPYNNKCIVEILSGSFNIHDKSSTKENLIYTRMGLNDFYKRYLQHISLDLRCNSFNNIEVIKIIGNSFRIFQISTLEDLWQKFE